MDEHDEQIQSMKGDGPTEAEEKARKKNKDLGTEGELKNQFKNIFEEYDGSKIDDDTARLVDLIIDLIAERSEEKAEEIVDQHERDYDHDSWI